MKDSIPYIPDEFDENVKISPDGCNPVSHNSDKERAENSGKDGLDIHFPGVIPPSYFPGYVGSNNSPAGY